MEIDNTNNKFDVFDDLLDEKPESDINLQENSAKHLRQKLILEDEQFKQLYTNMASSADKHTPTIIKTTLNNNCSLETIIREGLDQNDFTIDISARIETPAKRYSFQLDDFQKAAVASIESNTSVLVAAHTSAGKTAVAEYVIAKCLANNQRVIYTSPIKALSNQKYRDLKAEFGSVGLVTGDITIDENQSCLVMTTEILRNMLFRSNEVAKETAWIIFDEVHYLKDRERGVIWEETIILAPKNVRYCLLSATTPNASELAQWILRVKSLDCINVIYTDFRPTPLEYFAYKSGEKRIYMMKDRKGTFISHNFEKISSADEQPVIQKKKSGGPKGPEVINIIKMIKQKDWVPAIVFAFSKKEVEQIAKAISQKMKMLDASEIAALTGLYTSTISALSAEDQKLPQVVSLLDIIKSGVGLHHGGMLPILKELVEILFQMGLLKVLISTETFSMGVNMPAKCVVFSSVQKFDGEEFRVLSGSEFVQMSGRAGRRGKDKKGVVITMVDDSTNMKQYELMLRTESKHDPLISQFDVSYNMLLNAFMLEGFEPEHMIEKSFKQFQHDVKKRNNEHFLTNWEAKVKALRRSLFDANMQKFDVLLRIIDIEKRIRQIQKQLNNVLIAVEVILPWINIGRLLFVEGLGWVTALNFNRNAGKLSLDVVTPLSLSKNKRARKKIECNCFKCATENNITLTREPKVLTVDVALVRSISQVVISVPSNLEARENLLIVVGIVNKVIEETNHEVPIMNLGEHIKLPNERILAEVNSLKSKLTDLQTLYSEAWREYETAFKMPLNENLNNNQLFLFDNIPALEQIVYDDIATNEIFYSREALDELFVVKQDISSNGYASNPKKIMADELTAIRLFVRFNSNVYKLLTDEKSQQNTIILQQKIDNMRIVLKRLGFIDNEGVPTVKGRVAGLIFGSDELLLTELIFMNQLTSLSAKQIDVILSLFVNEERKSVKGQQKFKDERVAELLDTIKKTLGYLCGVYADSGLTELKEEEVIEKLNPSLFDVIAKWYDGASFFDICKISDMYEGSIIRGIKRLYELLKQLSECAKSIGNKELMEKFEEASKKLYRGIVFTASLYL